MHFYRAYGIEIRSDLNLPGLAQEGEGRDVRIELSHLAPPGHLEPTSIWRNGIEAQFGGTPDDAFLLWPGVTSFRAESGDLLQFDPDPTLAEHGRLSQFAISEALGIVLVQRGYFLLHASAVQVGDEAVVFVGRPGAGKSTIAAACARHGYPILGDDLVALSLEDPNRAIVHPGPPMVNVWPDSARGLGFEATRLMSTPGHPEKLMVTGRSGSGSLPVRNIFFLEQGRHTKIQSISLRDAQLRLLSFFPCPSAMLDRERSRAYFFMARRLLDRVRCWRWCNSGDFRETMKGVARLGLELSQEDSSLDPDGSDLDRRMNARFSFVDIIAPRSVADFLERDFEKTPFHIGRDDPGYFDSLLTVGQIDAVLRQNAVPSRLVRVHKDGTEIPSAEWSADGIVQSARLFALFHDSATVIINESDKLIDSLRDFCDAVEAQLGMRVQPNIYMTPPDSRGFAPHYDNHDVLILQTYGSKLWRLYNSPEILPGPRQNYVKGKYPIDSPEREVGLRSGDSLYLPRGFIHAGAASSEGSVHITLGLHPSYGHDLVSELGRLAENDPRFRRAVPCSLASEAEKRGFREEFTRWITELVAGVRVDDLILRRTEAFVSGRRKHGVGRFMDVMKSAALEPGTIVSRRDGTLFFRKDREKTIEIHFEGRIIEVSRLLSKSIQPILEGKPFAVRDIGGLINDQGRLELVRRFVQEGFLRIESVPEATLGARPRSSDVRQGQAGQPIVRGSGVDRGYAGESSMFRARVDGR